MLKANNISVSFGELEVLRGATIQVEAGQCVVLKGRSGGGKTTLLRVLGGLLTPSSGDVSIDGGSPLEHALAQDRAGRIPYELLTIVFQQQNLWPNLTIQENLSLVLENNKAAALSAAANAMLEQSGVIQLLEKYPLQCSVGQRQRVSVARALLSPSKYVLMDEPTSALDKDNRYIVRDLIKAQTMAGRGFLIISHDDRDFDGAATAVHELEYGRIEPIT